MRTEQTGERAVDGRSFPNDHCIQVLPSFRHGRPRLRDYGR